VTAARPAEAVNGLDRTLAALADPCRRRVVDLLRESPRRAGDLAQATRVSFPAMSRHLRTLRESGLVEEERAGFDSRVRVYRLKAEPMAELKKWLQETEDLWSLQLTALREHLQK
jgi:DNA-binding transcriptional ArsR family regulator